MKGEIKPDHLPKNRFSFKVLGLIDLTAITISGIEDEIEKIELPDRTMASGGENLAGEFEIEIPLHHDVEFAAMEAWFQEAKAPVLPTYKKPATLSMLKNSGSAGRNFTLTGVWVSKRTLPDLDKQDEGEMATAVYTLSYDDIMPI